MSTIHCEDNGSPNGEPTPQRRERLVLTERSVRMLSSQRLDLDEVKRMVPNAVGSGETAYALVGETTAEGRPELST